ncbi:MAG: DsbA family protein [Myxococcota bacterium]|nr:DsbA family protein [Myxococcota bacterium]
MQTALGRPSQVTVIVVALLSSACGPAATPAEEPRPAGTAVVGAESVPRRVGRRPRPPQPAPPPPRLPEQVDPLTDLPMVALPDRPDAPARGPQSAPIRIVVFSDFECSFCGRLAENIDQVRERYGDLVRVAFRNFPLGFHRRARPAAEAAMAAAAQGRFWEYHDLLFSDPRDISDETLRDHAKRIGLDLAAFQAALGAPAVAAAVDKDVRDGQAAGVTGTPTCFVNGRRLVGARPIEEFVRVIDLLLGSGTR